MKRIFFIISICLLSLSVQAQTNGIFKGIVSMNVDSAVFKNVFANLLATYDSGDVGGLYYNRESLKWRIFYDSAWHDLIGGSGGGGGAVNFANNGTILSGDTVQQGGDIYKTTNITVGVNDGAGTYLFYDKGYLDFYTNKFGTTTSTHSGEFTIASDGSPNTYISSIVNGGNFWVSTNTLNGGNTHRLDIDSVGNISMPNTHSLIVQSDSVVRFLTTLSNNNDSYLLSTGVKSAMGIDTNDGVSNFFEIDSVAIYGYTNSIERFKIDSLGNFTVTSPTEIFLDNGTGYIQMTNGSGIFIDAGSSEVNLTDTTLVIAVDGDTGSAGQYLASDGAGKTVWANGSGSTSPAGSDTEIQYNDSGSFGASEKYKVRNNTGTSVGEGFSTVYGSYTNSNTLIDTALIVGSYLHPFLAGTKFYHGIYSNNPSATYLNFVASTGNSVVNNGQSVSITAGAGYTTSGNGNGGSVYLEPAIGNGSGINGSLYIKSGSDRSMGTAVLSGGTVTVNNSTVTANSRIFLTTQSTSGTPGFVYISARSAGTSFTITSSSGTDASTVAWLIIEPF